MEQTNNNFFFWRLQLRKEVLFIFLRLIPSFILEKALEMLKKNIEELWYHHEFFQMMSKENKDIILRNHFGIIRPVFECFWKSIFELYFYMEYQSFFWKEGTILSILENDYEYIKSQIEQFWKGLIIESYTNNQEWNEDIRRNKDFILQDHYKMIRKEVEQFWENYGQELLFRVRHYFILEEVLEMLKKEIEQFWYHHEFFQMMSKEDKDVILRDHFGIIRQGIEPFWRYLYEFYFYEEDQVSLRKKQMILSRLGFHHQCIKDEIQKFYKSLNESDTNSPEWNEGIRRNKDFIFQDHCKIIRKGMEQLWQDLGQEALVRLRNDLILEEVLEMMKKQIEGFWYHHEFFQMMSKENKDIILRNHFGIIKPVIEWFWKYFYELFLFFLYKDKQHEDLFWKEGTILSILENDFEYLKDEIDSLYKSLNESYTNSQEWNEEIRRNKDFIFQDLSEMIRKEIEQLWEDPDSSNSN